MHKGTKTEVKVQGAGGSLSARAWVPWGLKHLGPHVRTMGESRRTQARPTEASRWRTCVYCLES